MAASPGRASRNTTKAKPKPKAKPEPKRAIFRIRHGYPDGEGPVEVYLAGLATDSQRVQGSALGSIADMLSGGKVPAAELAWHALRPAHVATLRERLQKLYQPATANRYLSTLRGVLEACWRLEHLDRETLERTLDVPPIRGKRQVRGRAVPRDELRALFEACQADENYAAGARDAALLALLYGTGLRRSEAAGLALEDVDLAAKKAKVLGKGNKTRTVYFPAGTAAALERWLALRGHEPGALFTAVSKAGKIKLRPISALLVYRVVQKRQLAAGVKAMTPHDLRRSFISDVLDEGIDLATVSRQVGHSSVQTTARYDRRGERSEQASAEILDVPFE